MSSYIPIASQTLGSSASSVTFSSIPTTLNGKTLRDLVLVISAKSSSASNFTAIAGTLNNDSSSIYNFVYMAGTGSAATSDVTSNFFEARFSRSLSNTDFELVKIDFLDYAQTNKHKVMLARAGTSGSAAPAVAATALRYASTNAITTITLTLNDGSSYLTGSTFSLYGLEG
jgi:hypothetical protein